MAKYIDLHTHSLASDGTDHPEKLVSKALKAGLTALALTDHDTVDGLEKAGMAADELGLEFIPGCEIAVLENDPKAVAENNITEMHILGLYLSLSSKKLRSSLSEQQNYRLLRNRKIMNKLDDLGLPLTMEDILQEAGGSCSGRPHIARAMVAKSYVPSVQTAFSKYLGEGCLAFAPRKVYTPEAGIRVLKAAEATVVLAHPCISLNMPTTKLEKLVKEYKDYGLDAIEAFHPAHSRQDIRLCLKLAKKYDLLVSGGSDYHGPIKAHCQLGYSKSKQRIPYLYLQKIKDFRKAQGLAV